MQSIPSSPAIPAQALPSVRYLPIGFFGAVMSVAGLALAWRLAHKFYGVDIAVSNAVGIAALALFAVLALSYLGKAVRYPDLVKQEFSHPVTGNFFGTVGISILLLSSVISVYSSTAYLVVWTIGAAVSLALSAVMISRLLNGNGSPTSVVPAWLIMGVGTLDIVVTGGAFTEGWAHEINLLAAGIGGVSAIVFFVLIFSRLVHHEPLAAGMRPSKMILVAPFGVGFIAYVNLVQRVDMFAALLFYFGLFLFAIISYRLLVKPPPFSLNWWAVGFPLASLANAALMYSNAIGGAGLGLIAIVLLSLLTISIAVLSIRTLHALATGRLLTA
ncbi:C4-dicarboxylate ABC transporter [Oxalobacteraceae bacterium CAVE-383]|nr:C4-dicarboxylate ABC transporter [Oxalobacteraceae bacterium CAVE-383]